METFEETSRITNVSATMFPSLPRALLTKPSTYLIGSESISLISFVDNSVTPSTT